jgi:hypothetical protein
VEAVSAAIRRALSLHQIAVVVSSAACGADILALEAAAKLGLRTRIVLPFDRARFCATSVVDRGKEWGPRFDAVLDRAAARNDVIVLEAGDGDDDAAYARATQRILEEAVALGREQGETPVALVIWDEQPREGTDATRDFLERATAAGMTVVSISTLEGEGESR